MQLSFNKFGLPSLGWGPAFNSLSSRLVKDQGLHAGVCKAWLFHCQFLRQSYLCAQGTLYLHISSEILPHDMSYALGEILNSSSIIFSCELLPLEDNILWSYSTWTWQIL